MTLTMPSTLQYFLNWNSAAPPRPSKNYVALRHFRTRQIRRNRKYRQPQQRTESGPGHAHAQRAGDVQPNAARQARNTNGVSTAGCPSSRLCM